MTARNTFTVANCLDHLSSLTLSTEAFAYAKQTFLSEPTDQRRHFAKSNVCGKYSAASQGVSIGYRSHGLELAWILRWELDPKVYAYRDRPPAVELHRSYRDGRRSHENYVPDFLLLTDDSVIIVDIRSESSLKKKLNKHGKEWIQKNETYCYLPASEHFTEMGLQFKILSDLGLNKLRTSNLKSIISAANDQRSVSGKTRKTIKRALDETALLSIANLLNLIDESSLYPILKLLYEGELYMDLDNQLVTQIDSCVVALNSEYASDAATRYRRCQPAGENRRRQVHRCLVVQP